MPDYSFRLDEAEVARYKAMASRALAQEASLWDAAGITTGVTVVDLGCGPGTFLPALAERTAPTGRVTGVDGSEDAVVTARSLIRALRLEDRIEIVRAQCDATGLPEGSFDAVLMRNVLIHNGPTVEQILGHAHALLRRGGHLLAMEIDVTELVLPDDAPDEQDLEQRWIDWARASGNDPAIGRRLAGLIGHYDFSVDATQERVDELRIERSPAWTSRQTLLSDGFASDADIERWDAAIAARLANVGLLDVRLPVYVVVAQRAEQA
jgi:ubiquinone/menaquinone biosynthesis C-methylase UbiE